MHHVKKCFSLIMLDSVVEVKKKHYPQTFLEEWKYESKKTKLKNPINDELESSSSDDKSNNESDNECDNEFANKSQN